MLNKHKRFKIDFEIQGALKLETEDKTEEKQPAKDEPKKEKPAKAPSGHKKCIVVIAMLVVLLAAGGIFAYYYYDKNNKDKTGLEKEIATAQKNYNDLRSTLSDLTKSKTQSSESTTEQQPSQTYGWKTYTNSKYGYSFKYPADWVLGPCVTKPDCKHVYEQEGGNNVTAEYTTAQKTWVINVSHYGTQPYNPPANANTKEWITANFVDTADYMDGASILYFTYGEGHLLGGFDVSVPGSPQAYAQRVIYIPWQNKIFKILMLDTGDESALDFYDTWLTTFSIDGQL